MSSLRTGLGFQLAAIAVAAVIVFVVEGIHGIALWNTAPLILALGSLKVARGDLGSQDVRLAGFAFWACQVVSVTLLHMAWYFDWGGLATRSSTAGLVFLVAPVYVVTTGFVLAGLTILASLGLKRWIHGGA